MLLLLVGAVCLSGCDGRQIEDQLLVVLMGVDETQDGQITISVKVPIYGALKEQGGSSSGGSDGENSGTGGGSGEESQAEKGYTIVESTEADIESALTMLHAVLPRTLNFSQVREIVFGENAAQGESFFELYHRIASLPSIRSQAYVVVCKGEAKDFLSAQRAQVGSRLSKFIDQTFRNYTRTAYVPTTTLGDGLSALHGSGGDPLFIYGAVNKGEKKESGEDGAPLELYAGEINWKGMGKIELLGAAMTDGTRVSGLLTGAETGLWRLLTGNNRSGFVMKAADVYVTVFSVTKARLFIKEDGLKASVSLEVQYHEGKKMDKALVQRMLEEKMAALIRKFQSFGCDALGFCETAKRGYWTEDAWKNANFKEKYESADIALQITLQFKVD